MQCNRATQSSITVLVVLDCGATIVAYYRLNIIQRRPFEAKKILVHKLRLVYTFALC